MNILYKFDENYYEVLLEEVFNAKNILEILAVYSEAKQLSLNEMQILSSVIRIALEHTNNVLEKLDNIQGEIIY